MSLLGLVAAIVAARAAQIPVGSSPAEVPLIIATGDTANETVPLPSDLNFGTATVPPTSSGPTPSGPTPSGPTPSGPTATVPTTTVPGKTPTSVPNWSGVAPAPGPSRSPTSARPSPSTTAAAACTVRYTFDSNWGSGFVASIVVTNTSGQAWSGWSGGFGMSPAASVTSSWGASMQASGGWVSFAPADYNAAVAAGKAVQIGFQAATTTTVTQLGPFSVNGSPCGRG